MNGTEKLPNNVQIKIITKYIPIHIDNGLEFFDGNNIKCHL